MPISEYDALRESDLLEYYTVLEEGLDALMFDLYIDEMEKIYFEQIGYEAV